MGTLDNSLVSVSFCFSQIIFPMHFLKHLIIHEKDLLCLIPNSSISQVKFKIVESFHGMPGSGVSGLPRLFMLRQTFPSKFGFYVQQGYF